jgi:hypothetical protein
MAGYGRNNVMRKSVKSTANTAVSFETGEPEANMRIFLQAVYAGYGGSGTLGSTGLLTIEDGMILPGKTTEENKVELPLASKGITPIELGYQGGAGKVVKFTLAAGGSEVTGYMTVVYYID